MTSARTLQNDATRPVQAKLAVVTAYFRLLIALLLTALAWLPGGASAQSACTAIWGVTQVSAAASAAGQLRYFRTNDGQWSQPLLNLNGWPNALAGSSANGLLYYVDRDTQRLYSIDLNANPLASTLIGTIPAPPAPASATNMLGATTDAAGNLFVYATGSTGGTYFHVTVAQISVSTAATLTSWTQIKTTSGATATLAGSGDSFIDQSGTNWIISNTNPPTLHQLDLNPGASFGRTNSPALSLNGVNSMQVAAVSTDPVSGATYLGGLNGATSAPYTSVTFLVDLSTGNTTNQVQSNTGFFVGDMGNCTVPPAAPSVSKEFSPTFRATAPGTTTVKITLENTNSVPIWLNRTLTDTLPAGLLVNTTPSLAGSCIMTGNTVTAVASSSNMVMSVGSRIPAGGCTITFVARAAAAGSYLNTIPAGSLSTTSGSNAAQAQAQFQVAVNDFSLVKEQRTGNGAFDNAPISVPRGDTLQFRLTVVNGAGSVGSGSVTFIDTLPTLITPVLSITATASGGGSCTTATSVVGGRTRITGTRTAAPIGSTCIVTISAYASATNSLSTFQNTATMAAIAPSTDSNASNNSATVTITIVPKTTLTIAKTNNTPTFWPGNTTSYTITVTNLGPADADGALVADPVATGLSCTAVSCTTSGGASCPTPPLSLATFQNTGIPVSPFPSGSTASFVLLCDVTATGVP